MTIKLIRNLLGLLLILLVVYKVLCVLAEPVPNHPYFMPDGFLVIAHRGGRSLGPESTLYTFRRAVDLGVDVLEMDLRSTKNGQLIIFHDSTVDRTTNGTGPVKNFNLAELKQLDAAFGWSPDNGCTFPLRDKGITIPTLNEVFAAFPNMRMNIEIKDPQPDIVARLCRLIRDYKKTNTVLIASFDAATLKRFRSLCSQVATSVAAREAYLFYGLQWSHLESAYSPSAQALQIPMYYGNRQVVTRRLLEAAHARNMRVHVWTVNDSEEMQRLLKLGVDGIMTDDPEKLLKLLKRNANR